MQIDELMPLLSPSKPKKQRPTREPRGQGSTIFLTHEGKTQSLKDWAEEIGKPVQTIVSRYQKGWNTEKILSKKSFQLETRQSLHWRKPLK